MVLLQPSSLAATLDNVNDALFRGQAIPKPEKAKLARWIAGRHGLAGCYADMFAPTESDFACGFETFTGEHVWTRASVAHILGQESCRVLILLDADLPTVTEALDAASAGFLERFARYEATFAAGTYCCGKCSCSFWRHLAAGGLENQEQLLACGLKALKACRQGNGHWRRYPFYYTLLALSEMPPHIVREELRYAAGRCERVAKRSPGPDLQQQRRRMLAERILARV